MKLNPLQILTVILILSFITIQFPNHSIGAPSEVSEFQIKAKILNITFENERTYYKIEIIESESINGGSNNKAKPGKIIKASKYTGVDCEINDIISAKLSYQCDEFREWYWLDDVELANNENGDFPIFYFLLGLFIFIFILVALVLYIFTRENRQR